MDDYPDSEKGDLYALSSIMSYYKYAQNSIIDKQEERYQKVIADVNDFEQRFPTSKLTEEVETYRSDSENNIKKLQTKNNEQTKTAAKR
jgi:outer membrane protein assembly factor BamD